MAATIIPISRHPRARSVQENEFIRKARSREDLRAFQAMSDADLVELYRDIKAVARDYQASKAQR